MLKVIKKMIIILLLIIIETLFFIYRIISKFWKKYNSDFKNIAKSCDYELRRVLNSI